MEINARLKATLNRIGITQKEIASAIGVREETFSRWIHGRLSPKGENLIGVLRFLQTRDPSVTIDDIVESIDKAA